MVVVDVQCEMARSHDVMSVKEGHYSTCKQTRERGFFNLQTVKILLPALYSPPLLISSSQQ